MSNPTFRFQATSQTLSEISTDWLVVFVPAMLPTESLRDLDRCLNGTISRLREAGDLTGKPLECLTLYSVPGLLAKRLMLIGIGEKATRSTYLDATAVAFRQITSRAWGKVTIAVPEGTSELPLPQAILAIAAGVSQGSVGPGLRKSEAVRFIPNDVQFNLPLNAATDGVAQAVQRGAIEAEAVAFARELVNLPPCDLYPDTFVARAATSGNQVICETWDEKKLISERMGGILAVGRGSARPPRMVILRYMNGGTSPAVALIGKGVTFDSGGLSLKTNEQMVDMKGDMAGAATVLAAIRAVAELRLAVNVIGYMPLVENMPGNNALKLGDVYTARNGKTVEVLNTDAEGRLILADALAYAAEFQPVGMVDLATLTGSCMIALGTQTAGLMSNNSTWATKVGEVIAAVGERCWPLPLDTEFDDAIRSKVADIKNVGSNRYGGASIGGAFLKQFVGDIPWVHLDIAGPAWADHESSSRDAGGTGAYVRSLIELCHRCALK